MSSQVFRNFLRLPQRFLRSSRSLVSQDVILDKNKFQADLDVHDFTPDEITVKASDSTVTVEGKHEEREDEYGFISRHFVRKFVIPEGHDIGKIESKLSSDGVLTITLPRTEPKKEEERDIHIVQTGLPSKVVEHKKEKRKRQYQIM